MKKLLICALMICGCDDRSSVKKVKMESTNTIQAQDFALNAVGGLIKGGMADSDALQNEINKPGDDNPYTRVDIDDDGNRDIILINEVEPHAKFEFIAHPGNNVPDQSIAIATFTTGDDGSVQYRANYTDYVGGYDNPDYRYYDTFTRDLLWIAWLTTPSRPLYLGVPTQYGYYHVVPRQQFIIRQTTVFRTTNIRVTQPAPRSMTFGSSSYSSRVTTRTPVQSRSVSSPPSRPVQVSKPTVTKSYSSPSRRR
jgi:hypothetical protein